MKIEQVKTPPHFRATCLWCHKTLDSSKERIWADLDGPSFKAYFCDEDALFGIPSGRVNTPKIYADEAK